MSEPFQVWICWVPQTAPRQTSWPGPRRWDRTRPPAPSPPPCPRAGTASSCRTRTGSRAPGAGHLREEDDQCECQNIQWTYRQAQTQLSPQQVSLDWTLDIGNLIEMRTRYFDNFNVNGYLFSE